MRNVRPGSIQEAVQRAIRAAGGLECVSNDTGVSVANLSRATSCEEDRPGGLGINHLDRLGRIVPVAAAPLAAHFAHLAGGIFQPLEVSGPLALNLSEMTTEFADVLSVHGEATSARSENPADYTVAEARRALKEIDELLSAAARYRAALMAKAGGGSGGAACPG